MPRNNEPFPDGLFAQMAVDAAGRFTGDSHQHSVVCLLVISCVVQQSLSHAIKSQVETVRRTSISDRPKNEVTVFDCPYIFKTPAPIRFVPLFANVSVVLLLTQYLESADSV